MSFPDPHANAGDPAEAIVHPIADPADSNPEPGLPPTKAPFAGTETNLQLGDTLTSVPAPAPEPDAPEITPAEEVTDVPH